MRPSEDIERLIRAEHWDPFCVLGPHTVERQGVQRILVRTIQPYAASVSVVVKGETIPAERAGPGGIFELASRG